MRPSRLGYVLYVAGLILLSILAIEELLNNFNYYYYNQVNFLLLFLAGLLSFLTGIILFSRSGKSKGQNLLDPNIT
jgi:hypothetical protein